MVLAVMVLADLASLRVAVAADDGSRDEAPFNKAEAAEVSVRLRAEPRLTRTFAACPADVFARERPLWRLLVDPAQLVEQTCARHPAQCYDLCLNWVNGPACFELARAYQHQPADVTDELDAERLFTLACAMGFPAGCTNRAAGIRNGDYREDPFGTATLADKQACEYRSFLLDCDRRGAWDCAMLGQAYRNGEGVAKQANRAKTAFETSCAINATFAACDFAKAHLKAMDKPDAPPDKGADPNDGSSGSRD